MNFEFEEVFGFVNNKILRGHMSDTLQSSLEFSAIAKEYPEPIRSIFYKTVIIQLASIIEACLHYTLLELGFDHYKSEYKYKDINVLYALNDEHETEIISGKRSRKKMSFEGYIDFSVLNKFCLDEAKLYDSDFYKEIDGVRQLRNKIHLMSLSEIDKGYSKKQVENVAESTNKVLSIIEKALSKA